MTQNIIIIIIIIKRHSGINPIPPTVIETKAKEKDSLLTIMILSNELLTKRLKQLGSINNTSPNRYVHGFFRPVPF